MAVTFPVFLMVTVCTPEVVLWVTLPKGKGLGAAVRVTTAAMPVPVRASEPLAFPATFSVAARAPAPAGLNVKVMVQEAAGAMIFPLEQVPAPVLVTSAAFVPLNVKYGVFNVRLAVPVDVTVTVLALLVVPTI